MKEVNEELEGERPVWCSEHGRWECEEHFEDGNTDDKEPIERTETVHPFWCWCEDCKERP